MKISNRTLGKQGCPYCAGKRIKVGFNDLATTHQHLICEWDPEKNKKTPQDYTAGSGYKAWWKCKTCGYSFSSAISSRTQGHGCPACAGKVVVKGINDLQTQRKDLLAIWNYERNTLPPDAYTATSQKKVWWKCDQCGHEWFAVIHSVASGCRCPECAKRNRPISRNRTRLQQKGSFSEHFPNLLKEWDYSRNKKSPDQSVLCDTAFMSAGVFYQRYNYHQCFPQPCSPQA